MASRTVLVVDDDPNILELMRMYLERDGFAVEVAGDGVAAIEKYDQLGPDLLVLDIMLPGRDGWEVCRQIRSRGETPIIILSARSGDHEKILGLELGADDYLTKPFNPHELVARVRAVLRRTGSGGPCGEVLQFPGLYVNRSEHVVRNAAGEVSLTAREFDILWLLMQSPGRVFTREVILDSVWGLDRPVEERTVDSHIKRIRRKLCCSPRGSWEIQTVWGVGYRFVSQRFDDEGSGGNPVRPTDELSVDGT
ncbi:MAG: response regulator transcription factor [Bacillota bacterium]